MRVLFLDFDGVLNNFTTRNFGEAMTPISCMNLSILLDGAPDLKIVISSAWRMWGRDYCAEVLQKNGIDSSRVIDITGNEQGIRGHQIQCWLDQNPGVTAFVIIDDESDMGHLMDKLVKTSGYVGLTLLDVERALVVLENQK